MTHSSRSALIAGLLAAIGAAGCSNAMQQAGSPGHPPRTPAELAAANHGHPPFNDADVRFMTGMIGHHAQAVLMAGWAASHGASPSVQGLCERIVVAQRDEIHFMQTWLADRNLPVPAGDASHDMDMGGMDMPGMDMGHPALMPGMLTPEQLKELDAARGAAWDRLFLTDMIQHHQGAISMVATLLDSYGAAQDDAIYKYATDVNADQTVEIDRMNSMLAAMPAGGDAHSSQ